MAQFTNVKRDKHTLIISYAGQTVEKPLDLTTSEVDSDTQNINLNVTLDVKETQKQTRDRYLIGLLSGLALIALAGFFCTRRRTVTR
jgi:hypothetical protein